MVFSKITVKKLNLSVARNIRYQAKSILNLHTFIFRSQFSQIKNKIWHVDIMILYKSYIRIFLDFWPAESLLMFNLHLDSELIEIL